ncbi:transient receptor potential cation channel subfamily V member 1 [Brachyhypopomus gauderio]|uniref:transient receptor potential cation channel subfamily V member 1 n=1 Tax=Brachyhypopomus gauderio TaxID=698409 RepID=UPI004041BCA6
MNKQKSVDPKCFSLEMDDRTDEERAKAKADRKERVAGGKGCPMPMDTDFLEDQEAIPCQVRFNLNFDKKIRGIREDPKERENVRFDRKRLFDAVSSGDVAKLEGLHDYLKASGKKLTNTEYQHNGKTALLKALLNLKNGENETIEHLLDIAEKMDCLKEFVNASYTDYYYEGQTALHVAIERRSKHFVELLLQKKADVHIKACGRFFQLHAGTCFYFGELPLSLAACTNQKGIVDLLMNNSYQKADVRQTDSQGNTVLHALVVLADNSPENTEFVISMYDYILAKDAQLNPRQGMLEHIVNCQGLTPIKLAAKTGKIGLFEHILHREFQDEACRHLSRKFTEWAYGPVYSSLFDLASLDTYEKNSVLEIIIYNTETPNRLEMLQVEPLNKLLEDKWDRFAHRIFFINFIIYVLYLSIFTAMCYTHKDKIVSPDKVPSFQDLLTNQNTEDYLIIAGQIITSVGSIYFFFKGLLDIKRKRPRLQTLLIDGYSDLLFFFQAVLFLVAVVLYLCKQKTYVAFLVVSLAMSWINLLFFSRGSKHMGIYSVMIQRMILGDILRFLFVYIVFLIGFSAAVATLLNEPDPPQGRTMFSAVKNTTNCKVPTYTDIYFTIMEMFKFTIGMGDLEFTEEYKYKHVFYLLLISYIVLTYILLLNMLIALMSKTVETMSKESSRIWKLQRAITTIDLEKSLPQCLKTKLRSGVEKDLGRKEKDLRWCLRVEEVNWNKWNSNLGIINEDPGNFSRVRATPIRPQREQSWRGFLREFSRRRPNTHAYSGACETSPLATASV